MRTAQECKVCADEVALIDIIAAVCQTIFKFLFAQLTGSISLSAASLVSFGDMTSKAITFASIKISRLPPSQKFPFGYGKIQFLGASVIGVALIISAMVLMIRNMSLVSEINTPPPGIMALVAITLSALASELMYRYLNCSARVNKNSNLLAASIDNRLDAFSGLIVFFGILFSHLGIEDADYWAAVIISLIVMYFGFKILYDSLKNLLDVSLPDEVISEVKKIARRTVGVVEVEYCRGRSLGETWELSLQVAMDENLNREELKIINNSLREKILDAHPRFSFLQISNNLVERQENLADEEILNAFRQDSL